jgi:hypothetical protein
MKIKNLFLLSSFLTYGLVCNAYASDDGWGFLSPEEMLQLRQAAEHAEIESAMGRFTQLEMSGTPVSLSSHEQEAWSAFELQKRVRDALRQMPSIAASFVSTNITNAIPLSIASPTPNLQVPLGQENEDLRLAQHFERQKELSATIEAILREDPDADVSFLFEEASRPMPTMTSSTLPAIRSKPKMEPVREMTQREMEERSAYVQDLLSRDPGADVSDLFNPSIPLPAKARPHERMHSNASNFFPSVASASSTYSTKHLSSDIALAQRLAQGERESTARAVFQASSTPALLPEDRTVYLNILGSFLAISDDVDVHTMTRSFCARWYDQMKRLEQKYLAYTSDLTPESYMKGLETFKRDLNTNAYRDHFSASSLTPQYRTMISLLETNKGFWVQGAQDVDGETGQSLREAFAHVYTFACRMDAKNSARLGREMMEYRGLFCSKLAENIETDGGCHPGITGRLVALYATMLFASFGLQGS